MKTWLRYLLLLWMSVPLSAGGDERLSVFHPYAFNDQPYGFVTCMAQDREGVLWLGTENGLIRYDGSRFQRMDTDDALPALAVNSLMPHPREGLWIGSNHGLVRFSKGRFTLLPTPQSVGEIYVGYFGQDADGTAWIPMPGASLRTEGDRLVEDPGTSGWTGASYIAYSRRFGAMIAMDGQKRLFRREGSGRWIQFGEAKELKGLSTSIFVEDGEGTLWMGEGRQLWALPPGKTRFESRSHLVEDPIRFLDYTSQAADGSVVVFTKRGLLRIRESGVIERLEPRLGIPEDASISLIDQEGCLWLAGSNVHRRTNKGWFQCWNIPLGPEAKAVWDLLEERPGGRLWAACPGGIALRENGRWRWMEALKGSGVSSLARTPDGSVWFTSIGAGVWRLKPGGRRPVRIPGTSHSELVDSTVGPDGFLYVSLWGKGLLRVDPSGASPPTPVKGEGLIQVPNVGQLIFDAQGRLWIGSALGVAVLDGGVWRLLGQDQGLPGKWVRRLILGKDGTAWLSYNGPVGVTRVRYQNGQWKVLEHYDSRNGLPSNVIYDLALDGQERLWVATNLGLARLEGDGFRAFGKKDGLVSLDINGGSMGLDASGCMMVGTAQGFVQVPEAGPPEHPIRPQAMIREIETAERDWYLAYESPPSISPRNASLTFHFSTKALSDGPQARFQIRLFGLDDLWREVDERQARYPSVPPGEYTFQVRAAHRSGEWGPEASLPVRVLFPWYGTPWARMLWGMMAVGAVYGVSKFRVRQLVRQRDHLEAQVRSRTQEIEAARDELQRANEALEAQTLTDPMTGLRNRRYFELVVEDEVAKAVRSHQSALLGRSAAQGDLVFFLVDLDHFKSVNDTYGHDAGDMVLIQAAHLLQETVREMDAVIRWGGEEFLVLARDAERSRARELAERIRGAMESSCFPIIGHADIRLTCSIGFSAFPLSRAQPDLLSWKQTLSLADRCLYGVKRSGRNGWAGFMESWIPLGQGVSWVDGPVEELRSTGFLHVVHSPPVMNW